MCVLPFIYAFFLCEFAQIFEFFTYEFVHTSPSVRCLRWSEHPYMQFIRRTANQNMALFTNSSLKRFIVYMKVRTQQLVFTYRYTYAIYKYYLPAQQVRLCKQVSVVVFFQNLKMLIDCLYDSRKRCLLFSIFH